MADSAVRSAPLVSVVIPAYNAAATLAEAVNSVLSQSERSLEVLVIEDGSRDDTTSVAEACRRLDPDRVRVLRHADGANRGVAASRNLGIDSARGAFIAFLDSDDAWLPEKLRLQLEVMERDSQVGFVIGDVYLCTDPDPGRPMSEQPRAPAPFRKGMDEAFNADSRAGFRALNLDPEAHAIVPSPTPLVRRELFASGLRFAGPDRLRLQYEDYLMWKILSARTRMHCLREPVAIYRVHAASFTGRFQAGGSALRHLQGLSDVHEEFVREAGKDVEPHYLEAMFSLQADKINANAHRIDLRSAPAYVALAGKYRTAGRALSRLLAAYVQVGRIGAATVKRSILGKAK